MAPSTYFAIRGNGLMPSLWRLYYFIFTMLLVEFRDDGKNFRFSLRRKLIFVTVSTVLPILMIWNHFGFFLDDWLFPAWRHHVVSKPLFIVGNARSGTTWLHRLISYDEDVFTTFRTWELLFAASVTWRMLFYLIFRFDKFFCFGTMLSCMSHIERKLLGRVQVHQLGLQQAEEDDWVMLHVACTQLITFFYPQGTDILSDLILFDFAPTVPSVSSNTDTNATPATGSVFDNDQENSSVALPLSVRRAILTYYKRCVQRHMYFYECVNVTRGRDKRQLLFLSKNPAFTLRLQSLREAFPDCRVVCLLRDPIQSIPSMISYISMVWRVFADPVSEYPNARNLLSFCEWHYMHPLRFPEFVLFVSYHHLVQQLMETVTTLLFNLYGSDNKEVLLDNSIDGCNASNVPSAAPWRWKLNELFKERLRQEQISVSRYKSAHRHSLKQCCAGLSESELKAVLSEVYDTHRTAFQPLKRNTVEPSKNKDKT